MFFCDICNYGLTQTVDPVNSVVTMYYDVRNNMTRMTDPRNKDTYYYYDTGGCGGCGSGGAVLTKVRDPLGNETEYRYDKNGNMTKAIDALDREVDYVYDSRNLLMTVTSPSGSANHTRFAYDAMDRLVTKTDLNGRQTTFVYDHTGRMLTTTDAVGSTVYTYHGTGQISTVKDGMNRTTTYSYNSEGLLTMVYTPSGMMGEYVKYLYDTMGRVTQAGAGMMGTTDKTLYFYDSGVNGTGRLTKVQYYRDYTNYDEANYFYDDAGRVIEIEDWLTSSGNGLRYGYDNAGRMTSVTDYDNTTLTYTFDAAGNVVTMNDYHGNSTTYTYTDTGRLSTITAPGNKVWDFDYNALGMVVGYAPPINVWTLYRYDSDYRLTKIMHRNLNIPADFGSFTYTLDAVGNILTMSEDDGSRWEYEYDGRYRLTRAEHKNAATPTISGVHTFTYDAGDNLITKTTPFTDDFDDGNYNGWFVWGGTWSVTNKVLQQTQASGGTLMMSGWTDANNEVRFSYRNTNTAANEKSAAMFRFTNGTFDRSQLSLYPSSALIEENIGGVFYTRASTTISTVQGQWYDVRIVADGGSVKVWRGPRGGNMDLIFNATGVLSVSTTNLCGLYAGGTSYQFDDFQGIGGGVANTTTTYAYDSGNRQTSMTSMGVTTSNGYDDWGRLTTSARGGVTARYAWRYGSKLYSVDQDNNGTAEVTYKTGGDGKRRARIAGASETWYNWDSGYTVISEEAGSSGAGALTRTYVGRSLAHVDGSNPATGTWRYMYHDHLGSVRQVRDANRNLVAEYAFLPYGQTDAWSGTANATTRLFTGHDRDPNKFGGLVLCFH